MITILRLSHRPYRDIRTTTHCALVARAFGADEMVYTGTRDEAMEKSVGSVVKNWGGDFQIRHAASHRPLMHDAARTKVHLTMYGERIGERIGSVRGAKNLIVVIGGEKVPGEIYQMSDYNIGIGNQPHSEVAALAVFLHDYHQGRELEREFGGKIRVVPNAKGKTVDKMPEKRDKVYITNKRN